MVRPCKVATIFGTRPEAIKLFPLVHLLEADQRFDSCVVSTGQHRDMLDQVLDVAGVTPRHDLDVMQPNQSLDALTARLLVRIGEVLDQESPDWVVVQGDTATAMSGAMAAYYRKIPVCHVEAGLRSGDIYHPFPEEVNRKTIGTLATLHAAPTETSAKALRAENVDPQSVHVTGNTVIDALRWITQRVAQTPNLAADLAPVEARFRGKRIIAVTSHRRENFGDGIQNIVNAIRRLASREDIAIVFPVHFNPNVRDIVQKELANLNNVALLEPLDYPNFSRLLDICVLILTDSGGVQEEAPALGKPVLVMRETTERPEGISAGTAKLVGTDEDIIVRETERLLDDAVAYSTMARAHNPFGDGKSAQRIAALLLEKT